MKNIPQNFGQHSLTKSATFTSLYVKMTSKMAEKTWIGQMAGGVPEFMDMVTIFA